MKIADEVKAGIALPAQNQVEGAREDRNALETAPQVVFDRVLLKALMCQVGHSIYGGFNAKWE